MADQRIRNYYLASYIGMAGLFALMIAIAATRPAYGDPDYGQEPDWASSCLSLLLLPFVIGWVATALWWVHDAWSSIPEEHRVVPLVTNASPGLMVGLFFVPCFNLVWVFLVNYAIADSINRALEAQGSQERASSGLAMTACILHLVPYCNFLVCPIVWFLWMRDADRARARLAEIDADAVAEVFS